MSGDDVNVNAGLASGIGTAYDAEEISITISSKHRGSRASIPRTRADAAAVASETLRERTARRVQRTVELTDEGKSAREIGRIIATEEGSAEFPVSTVRGWRSRGKGSKP